MRRTHQTTEAFPFRIIQTSDGNEIIDRTLTTPYNALTGVQMVEYHEMDLQLFRMDKLEKQKRKEEEQRKKLVKNPLWKMACFCGIV